MRHGCIELLRYAAVYTRTHEDESARPPSNSPVTLMSVSLQIHYEYYVCML
jgi:hypothetical protein